MLCCDSADDDRYLTYTKTSGNPVISPEFLVLIKKHLNLDPSDSSDDPYLTLLAQAAIQFAEKYTKRTFVIATFEHYRDCFQEVMELRRSRLQILTSFEYSQSGSYTTVNSSLYYVTNEIDFSKIVSVVGQTYPSDIDDIVQAIKIIFTAGLAASVHLLPSDLQIALLNHIAKLYENRGDCDLSSTLETSLPATSRDVYKKYRIVDHYL